MKNILRLSLLILLNPLLSASERPNIVFLIADDISQEDFGCYGHPVLKTPHADKVAAAGIRFDNAYLTISSCSPSRCSIISGRYPHNTGAPELHVKMPKGQLRFPELLRKAGYYTVLSGKNHMFGSKDRAFDEITKGGGPSNSENWVEHLQKRPKDKPFFFWFASSDAHRGWTKSKDAPLYDPQDVVIPPYLVDSQVTRQDLALYYHEVSRFDHFVGEVVKELKNQDVYNNTMIIIAADNGRPFPRCKARLFDSGIKTPWIVHYPKIVKSGSVTKSLISSIDLSATCLELAGIEKPACIQGQSFMPILKNPNAKVRNMVFSEQNWHVYKNHCRMVRQGDFVYIKNNFPNQLNLSLESGPNYPAGKELWKKHAAGQTNKNQQQVFANPCAVEELYNLKKDPHQLVNLASSPELKPLLERMRLSLAQWSEETGDTVPLNPTQHRHAQPVIKDGKIIKNMVGIKRNKQTAMPGDAKNAEKINRPGPIKETDIKR